MTVKRVLILAPALIVVFLLQSYLWVPTYEQQTRGNPDRLNEYISASIGDASLLNPILSADTASSQIEALVFEGLIDRDEDLRFRGRLASSWKIFEEAYFYVNDTATVPARGVLSAPALAAVLQAAKDGKDPVPKRLRATLDAIGRIEVLPPRRFTVTKRARKPGAEAPGGTVRATVDAPARIKLTLSKVDQDLFQNLTLLLGERYFDTFGGEARLDVDPDVGPERRAALAAELIPATEHNPVILFRLRPGVLFHDGHPFGAGDVKFTFEAIMDPRNLSPRIADYEPVKEVEAVDPLTVRIVYKRLYSPAVGTWAMGILPEHLLNGEALEREAVALGKDPQRVSIRQSAFNRHPVGCGPFVFREWKSDQYIALERFDRYWEGPANYERYSFRVVPDLLTQEMEFYAGTIDDYAVQPHQVKRLRTDPRYQSFSGTSFGYTFIGYNMRRAPFDDVRVRRALGMAVDVGKIIDYVLYGQGERITGPFAKQTDYYDRSIPSLPYDPEGARALLAEAGWTKGPDGWLQKDGKRFQFTLITNSGNDLRKAVLAIAQDAWKRLGIDVRTDLLEWSVFIQERVDKADFDALVLGWTMGIDPDLYQIWHSSQANSHQLNFVGFENRKADELIVKIRQEYDFEKQVEYCNSLHRIIAEEQPYTFLYVGKWTAILDKRIVIRNTDESGNVTYERITPTKTGGYTFHFNKWIKLPEAPTFTADG